MIPDSRWRRTVVAGVLAADLLVLFVAGAALPGFAPIALGVLVATTLWALARPGGWGALALLLGQLLCVAVPGRAPATAADWVLAAASAAALLVTHLGLALLASWPRRAALPRESAARWARQTASLVWAGIAAGAVGAVATSTPLGWGPWVGALALGLVAVLVWQVRAATRRA